jgi:TolB protein
MMNHLLSPETRQRPFGQAGRCLLSALFIIVLSILIILPGNVQISRADSQPLGTGSDIGTIAYLRDGHEIRLIEPDGSNDRLLWSSPNPGVYGILDLAWKPDAAEIVFSSDHEGNCSIFEVDIYAIRPDGSDLRRVTNAPTCAGLAGFPKGNVSVTVENYIAGGGPFFVYIQGAPSILPVTVAAGGSATVTFNNVADFGNTLQQAVVIEGLNRWIAPIAAADVQPGQTVHAGTLQVAGAGLQNYGAHRPAWRSDGAELGFIFGPCSGMSHIAPNPPAGDRGELLQDIFDFGCVMDWRPIPSGSNQILYWSYLNGGIYQTTAGSDSLGTKLVETEAAGWVWQVIWLPDASGFLFSYASSVFGSANIYHYSFASSTITSLTNYDNAFTRNFSISPDGQQVVFELAATWDSATSDLWLMQIDGTNPHLLVADGHAPAWSWGAPQIPQRLYLPFTLN